MFIPDICRKSRTLITHKMKLNKNLGFILFLALTVTFAACKKEEGCTDVLATNYDSDAEEDDDSCEYPAVSQETDFSLSFEENGNSHEDPGVSATNLVPSNALSAGNAPTDNWFDDVTYKGAFGSSDWTNGWTLYDGYNPTSVSTTEIEITGTVVTSGSTESWTNDNVYILNGFCFVEGALNIQEGTIIKGAEGSGEDAAALIIARGATINAIGTVTQPIIFTYEGDPLDGSISTSTRGEWGGIIILGAATLNSSPGVTQIEGIPTNEPRGEYGGNDDSDNSGTISYISIRHGGSDIGAGNEINGLTLGGVGSGTTIEYVEVIANEDDGVEFFGGVARTKHILTAYCGDDSFDYDEGFRGLGQFWCAVQASDDGDRGGEHDGGTEPETATPYATPVVFNATYIGNGEGRALTFRDNAGGQYHNSIFVNWAKGVDIENLDSEQDSYKQFQDGELALAGDVFWNIAAGTEPNALFTISE